MSMTLRASQSQIELFYLFSKGKEKIARLLLSFVHRSQRLSVTIKSSMLSVSVMVSVVAL
jgi:hypothetical protein